MQFVKVNFAHVVFLENSTESLKKVFENSSVIVFKLFHILKCIYITSVVFHLSGSFGLLHLGFLIDSTRSRNA